MSEKRISLGVPVAKQDAAMVRVLQAQVARQAKAIERLQEALVTVREHPFTPIALRKLIDAALAMTDR